jgi:hypothetical protein
MEQIHKEGTVICGAGERTISIGSLQATLEQQWGRSGYHQNGFEFTNILQRLKRF